MAALIGSADTWFRMARLALLGFFCVSVLACSRQPETDPEQLADSVAEGPDKTVPAEVERSLLTRKQCSDAGGLIVGDIGDGRIHRPGYLCASGAPPIATIRQSLDEGSPVSIEGEVCCPQ